MRQQGSVRTRARKWCADVDLHRTRRRMKTCSHVHDYCSSVSVNAIACATRKCARDRIVAGRRREPLVSSDGGPPPHETTARSELLVSPAGGPSPHETTARSELLVSSDGSSYAPPSVHPLGSKAVSLRQSSQLHHGRIYSASSPSQRLEAGRAQKFMTLRLQS